MVYYTYARGPEHTDAVVATGEPATGTHLEVWTSDSGGFQITALKTVAGAAIPNPYVTVDPFGRYEFRIEDQTHPNVWMKDPSGKFWQVLASEIISQVPATIPGGSAAAYKVPWRDASNTYTWGAASAVVARALGWKIADDYGLDTTGATVHSAAAVQAWLDAGVPYASGTIQCSGAVTIKGDADLHLLDWNFTGASGVAITVGTGTGAVLFRKMVQLPRLVATAKTTTTWSQVAGTVGVQVTNANSCVITGAQITNFETGLYMYGQGQGCVYNTVRIAHLNNNKIQHDLAADATGWCNDNKFYIDRFSFNSAEGASVAGTRDIRVNTATSLPNNNTWIGGSVEADTPEYHLECFGLDNRLMQMRWENATGCRVYWRTSAGRNWIDGGYGVHTIVETFEAGALPQTVSSSVRHVLGTALPGAAVATTAYYVLTQADGIHVKPQASAFDRIFLESSSGKAFLGTGTAAPLMNFGAVSTSGIALNAGHLYSGTDNTYDIGLSASLRFRDLNLGRNAVVGGTAKIVGNVGFYGTTPAAKPTVTGSRGGNAALASLLTALAGLGILTDSSTA